MSQRLVTDRVRYLTPEEVERRHQPKGLEKAIYWVAERSPGEALFFSFTLSGLALLIVRWTLQP